MRINTLERIKEALEKEIIQRNYTSLRYVLFNKSSKLAHATHLYYENNKFYIENRDERGELIGNPYIFEAFSKAKDCFFEVLGEVVALNNYYNNTFGEVPYDSPLWSKSSDDDNKIIKEQYEVFHPEKTKNDSPIKRLSDDNNITLVSSELGIMDRYKEIYKNYALMNIVSGEVFHPEKTKNDSSIKRLSDDNNITLVSPKLGSMDRYREIYKNYALKNIVSSNEVVCEGNKKYYYYPYSNSMTEKMIAKKGRLKKGVGNYTSTTSQHL